MSWADFTASAFGTGWDFPETGSQKSVKSGPNSKQGQSERECGKLEAAPFPTLGGCGEHADVQDRTWWREV